MNEWKVALLAKWFANPSQIWHEDDPQLPILDALHDVAKEAYLSNGRFTEGSIAANKAVIEAVLKMEDGI